MLKRGVREAAKESGVVGRDRSVNSGRASAHVNNDTLPSKLAHAVDVIFTISAYEAMAQ